MFTLSNCKLVLHENKEAVLLGEVASPAFDNSRSHSAFLQLRSNIFVNNRHFTHLQEVRNLQRHYINTKKGPIEEAPKGDPRYSFSFNLQVTNVRENAKSEFIQNIKSYNNGNENDQFNFEKDSNHSLLPTITQNLKLKLPVIPDKPTKRRRIYDEAVIVACDQDSTPTIEISKAICIVDAFNLQLFVIVDNENNEETALANEKSRP
ncbi:MAG: hypothetical protein EXX96DRAFT_624546 [Benjaminiella poitrasii]|nr:MAG: hypothetical protein EXX96DRAFT_624546 [Benjaminiella poitrasii]